VGKTSLVNQLVQKYQSESLVVSTDVVDASNTYWLEQQLIGIEVKSGAVQKTSGIVSFKRNSTSIKFCWLETQA
jgi:hypothetical protein